MPVFCGKTPTLRDLIKAAEDAGCILRKFNGEFVGPEGPQEIHYLFNPANSRYWPLPKGGMDMPVAPSVVGSMERRLDIVTDYLSMDDPQDGIRLN